MNYVERTEPEVIPEHLMDCIHRGTRTTGHRKLRWKDDDDDMGYLTAMNQIQSLLLFELDDYGLWSEKNEKVTIAYFSVTLTLNGTAEEDQKWLREST